MTPTPPRRPPTSVLVFTITLLSVACVLCSLTAALMVAPQLLIKRPSYAARFQPNQVMELTWKPSDGDVFAALPGRVRPPQDDSPYAAFTLRWDADGFRVPVVASETYPIAVFGDSFTEGFSVGLPYADRLAEGLGVGVRNYGYRAYGPNEVAQAAREFADKDSRQWVIWGFFSGNDVGDTARPPLVDFTPWGVWSAFLGQSAPPAPTATPRLGSDGQPQYDFPVPVIIGGNYFELSFVPYYWYWQQAPVGGFEASQNFAAVKATLDVLGETGGAGTCHALVFIPTKEQLYFPYVHPGARQFLRAVNQRPSLGKDDWLGYIEAPISEDDEAAFFESLYGQRDAMKKLVEAQSGWLFIDLLPTFEEAVARGDLLYYPYDTHWNQAGHDLAAQVIADALRAHPTCTL